MTEIWTDHLDLLTGRLFPNLENFKREDPFSCYRETRSYFSNYIKSFERIKVDKSLEISWDYLKQGNFVSKPTLERISCYTQSIFYAPDDSPPLMIAYLRRSELLLETEHVKESENDSGMAFHCFKNNIDESQYETVFMNKEPEMMTKVVEGTLRKMKMPEEEFSYVQCEIISLLKRLLASGSFDLFTQDDEYNLPSLKYGENVTFPSSSNAVRVEYNREKGRHVIANCDIKIGDVLFVEKPFALVAHKLRCSHCCQISYTYIPCTQCTDMQYCSKACRDEDWVSSHKHECGFVVFLKQTGIGYLALKTLLKAESDIDKLKVLSEELKARENFTNTVFSKIKYENVYNLLTHSESIPIGDFLHYSLTALLLSFYLIHCTDYAEETEENAFFCATILLRHIIQLVSNAQAIAATDIEVDESCATIGEELEQIGSAIYPSVSIMNHSCFPSVFITFRRSYIIVKAGKDINAGEEVFNSYGVDCRRIRRKDRQEILRAQYLFDCKCEQCTEKYDRYDVLNSFKCGMCMGPLVREPEADMRTDSGHRLCLHCLQHQIIPEKLLSLELYLNGILKVGEDNLRENKVFEALSVFLKGWKISRQFLFAYHPLLSYLAKRIALCLFRLNNYKDCMKVLSFNMVCVKGRFGPYSSEVAAEAKKLSDLVIYYCRNVQRTGSIFVPDVLTYKEREYFEKCQKILRVTYGDDHPLIRRDTQNSTIPEYTG